MTRNKVSRGILWVLNAVLAAMVCMPAMRASGQPAPLATGATAASPTDASKAAAPSAALQLDLEALLTSNMVFAPEAQDDVWILKPGAGRFLVQLPFQVKTGAQPLELDKSTVKIVGSRARFLAWRTRPVDIEEGAAARPGEQNAGGGGDSAGRSIARGRDAQDAALREFSGDFSRPGANAGGLGGGARGGDVAGGIAPPVAGVALVENFEGRKLIPRFAGNLSITPDGRVKWDMDRRILNGELLENGQLYTLKIDNQKLNEKNPAAPPPGSSGSGTPRTPQPRTAQPARSQERTAPARPGASGGARPAPRTAADPDAAARQRAEEEMANVKMRLEREAFKRLREEVSELPDAFDQPLPKRIWAVFEMSQLSKQMELQSEVFPQLNWTIDFEQLVLLRQLSQGGFNVPVDPNTGRKALGSDNVGQLIQLGLLAEAKHPYSRRAVAYALHMARMGSFTEMGNQLFFIFQALLEGDDTEARQVAQQELLSTVPPTLATASLLKRVVKGTVADAGSQLLAIQKVFEFGAGAGGMQTSEMINTAQQFLDDPNGPPPGKVIDKLLDATAQHPEAVPDLTTGVQFDRMPEARLQQALVAVVERAGEHPLAAGWLDRKFIGAANAGLVRRSLQVIVEAEAGAQSLGPIIQWGMTSVLGMPENTEPTLKAKIAQPIPIDTVQHGMIRALQHGDLTIRDLAWRALPRFRLPPEQPQAAAEGRDQGMADAGGGQGGPGGPGAQRIAAAQVLSGQPLADRYDALLKAALDQSPTPIQIVQFLAAQPDLVRRAMLERRARGQRDQGSQAAEGDQHPDIDRAVHALVQIVLRGSQATPAAAARAIVGSHWKLDKALEELEAGERQGFAQNIYEALNKEAMTKGTPPVVVNVLRERQKRNPVVEWFGTQLSNGNVPAPSQWIEAFPGGQDQLLVLSTINDRDLARGAIGVLVASIGGDDRDAKEMADRVAAMPDKSQPKVHELWAQVRREIFAKQIRRKEGSYRLVLRVGPERPAAPAGPPGAPGNAPAPAGPKIDFSAIPTESEIPLGVVQLRVDGEKVSFGNQNLSVSLHPTRMAIVIDKPSEFKNFQNPDIEKLGLEGIEKPVELELWENGQWQGAFNIPNAKAVYVLLFPASDA